MFLAGGPEGEGFTLGLAQQLVDIEITGLVAGGVGIGQVGGENFRPPGT